MGRRAFQDRRFLPPSNINDPFSEPDVESEVKVLVRYMSDTATKVRRLMHTVAEIHDFVMPNDVRLARRQQVSSNVSYAFGGGATAPAVAGHGDAILQPE